jgi:hypothetical protein
MMQDAVVTVKVWFICQCQPEIRGAVADAVAKETWRSDANDGEWMRLNRDCRADNGAIRSELRLPSPITQHGGRGGGRCIVAFGQRAPGKRAKA